MFWQAGVPVAFDSTFRHDSANPTGWPAREILISRPLAPRPPPAAERRALATREPGDEAVPLKGAAQAVSGQVS